MIEDVVGIDVGLMVMGIVEYMRNRVRFRNEIPKLQHPRIRVMKLQTDQLLPSQLNKGKMSRPTF